MLGFYSFILRASGPALNLLLRLRCRAGKEDPHRLGERRGRAAAPRPDGPLVWFHAASVGESQATLILIDALLARCPPLNVLVTTGTVTSADLMKRRLPARALHQYYPLDHPGWVSAFLDHWRPDAVLWLESELWPNMLRGIKRRNIPAALINARLSPRSVRRWRLARGSFVALLGTFSVCVAQTGDDAENFRSLGAAGVVTGDNLKFSAAPLPADDLALSDLRHAIAGRPVWLYASTHAGEEKLACRLHNSLKNECPGLLTIIVPRHPERRADIMNDCADSNLALRLRGADRALPRPDDDIYIADTLGELGLFYRLAPVACIGRSFSDDGGGGHNPIEAAQLGCAVLHGPHVQNLAAIYADFAAAGAAISLRDETDFRTRLSHLLGDPAALNDLREKATAFAARKTGAPDTLLVLLAPVLGGIIPGTSADTARLCA